MALRAAILAMVALCEVPQAHAEARWAELNHAARAAVEARDYAKLHETLVALAPLMPGNVRVAYNLAASSAMLGHADDALAGVERLCRMGVIFDLGADSDFDSLEATERFGRALECMSKNGQPVTHATLFAMLPGEDLLPEDLAYDAKTKRFFVSSIRRNRILDTTGKVFATSDWPILALAIDDKRRVLWASSGWLPQCDGCKPDDKDKTALLRFDLDRDSPPKRFESPVPGLLGDMTIGRNGDVYVTEGAHGAVLELREGAAALQRLDVPGEFGSPQQPALSADGKTLYVADYIRGIAAIDLATRAVTWPQPAPDVALSGIDGLKLVGEAFIAVQNGTNPVRIVKIPRDLKSQQVLEANWAGLGEPTHGIVVGRDYYFIANTGWNAYEDSGRKRAGSAPVTSSIWKLPLR